MPRLDGVHRRQITHFGLTPRYTLIATFADATNLHSGNPVRLAGVEVGLVSSVKLVNGQAEVHFRVNKNVTVPDDSEVAVRWVNLIGQRELYLYPGTSPTKLRSGARMTRTRSVVDLGQLFNELGPLTQSLDPKQVNNLLETLVTSFNGNIPNIDTITADLKSILGTLASRKQTISQMISDYQTLTNAVSHRDLQIQTAVDNLDALATAFAQSDSVLNDALVQLPKFSSNLNTFLTGNAAQLGQMIDGLQGITSVGHRAGHRPGQHAQRTSGQPVHPDPVLLARQVARTSTWSVSAPTSRPARIPSSWHRTWPVADHSTVRPPSCPHWSGRSHEAPPARRLLVQRPQQAGRRDCDRGGDPPPGLRGGRHRPDRPAETDLPDERRVLRQRGGQEAATWCGWPESRSGR